MDIQSSHCSNIFGTMRELVDATNQKYQNSQVKQINQQQQHRLQEIFILTVPI